VKEYAPDIAILDFAMPGADGLIATREIAKEMPKVRVLILTMHASKQLVREILEAGARGYVMKSDAGKDLLKAIDTLLEDKLFFTQTISEILLDGFLEKPQPMRPENLLTKRETEIVSLLARGKSNKEVATELNISLRTAETHRANIMNKLQLHSVQDLVRYAVKNKLVDV
jgi:DNA-binding NarL/FixJ family response regulator